MTPSKLERVVVSHGNSFEARCGVPKEELELNAIGCSQYSIPLAANLVWGLTDQVSRRSNNTTVE